MPLPDPRPGLKRRLGHWLRVPLPVRFSNFIFQRILRLNAEVRHSVHFTSRVVLGRQLTIGQGVDVSLAVSGGCYLQAGNGIQIGDGTIFAPGVKIISANHGTGADRSWQPGPPVRIGAQCWLGANSVILPGVTLGDGCVVGAGAVVTRSFPAGTVLVGVPAQSIRKFDSNDTI